MPAWSSRSLTRTGTADVGPQDDAGVGRLAQERAAQRLDARLRGQTEMVAAFDRTIFAQPDTDAARRHLRGVGTSLERSLRKDSALLADAEDDVTDHATLPRHHWRKICRTNPLERVDTETERRTDIITLFPTTT